MFKDFLYSLKNAATGRYYRINNGNVEDTSNYTPLDNTPDGWQEKSLKWTRDVMLMGVVRTASTSFKFVTGAKRIIRERLYKKGTEDKISLAIHKLDKSFGGGWIHKLFIEKEIDLTTVDDTDNYISASLSDDDINSLYQANKDSEIEIPMDTPGSESALMDGIELSQQATFLITNGTLPDNLGGSTLDMQVITVEEVSSLGARTQPRVKTGNSAAALWASGVSFLETGTTPTTVTINWDFHCKLEMADGVGAVNPTRVIFQLNILTSASSLTLVELQVLPSQDPLLIYNINHHFVGSKTVVIPANAKCITYMATTQRRDFTFFTYQNDGSFKIKYSYLYRKSYCRFIPPMVAGQFMVNKIFGAGYTFKSDYLTNGKWKGLNITCGDAIRGLANAKLKTTISKFISSYNIPCNISLNLVDKEISIEPKAFAFQQTTVFDFGEVSELSIKPDKDFKYNAIDVGYKNTETEDVNGKLDTNVTQTWLTDNKKAPKKLQLVSEYKAGCFEIELARIKLSGKDTTDASSDTEIFFLHCETVRRFADPGIGIPDMGYFQLYRKVYTSITGVPFPNGLFNVELSPHRVLLYHGNLLRSIFFQQESMYLQFSTSQKNDQLVTNDGGVIIAERSNILVGSLDAPLFYNYIATYECPIVDSIVQVMKESYNKQFSFSYDGVIVYGFVKSIELQPADNAPQQTTLMISPVTDILKFISDGR